MPTLPQRINTPQHAFFSKQYFVVSPVSTTAPATTYFGDRQVFSKMSPIEKKREIRKHRESGSRKPWIGGDTENVTAITFERGLSYDPSASNSNYLGMWNWYVSGDKFDLFVDVFNDTETAATRDPILTYKLEGAKPVRYKGFEGDAESADTALEEVEVEIEDITIVIT